MSKKYDEYLMEHITNVQTAYQWLKNHFPNYFEDPEKGTPLIDVTAFHDNSKLSPEEYDAYDKYFYGNNKSFSVVNDFNKAWLHHIHNNPHHWQHWVLLEDDPRNPNNNYICIEMPRVYVLEMISDWWSFSWKVGNPYEIFNWYDDHKKTMKLHDNTRKLVESILSDIRKELDEERSEAEIENASIDTAVD